MDEIDPIQSMAHMSVIDTTGEKMFTTGQLPGDITPEALEPKDIIRNTEFEGLSVIYNQTTGTANHTTRSMANLEATIKQILVNMFIVKDVPCMVDQTNTDHGGEIISWEIRFITAKLVATTVPGQYNKPIPLDPSYCIKNKRTYSKQVVCDIVFNTVIIKGGVQIPTEPLYISSLNVAPMPIDIGGYHCVLHGATQQQGLQNDIDLSLTAGLVIINGALYAVHVNEQLTFNQIHVYKHLVPFRDELARANIICRRGIGFEHSFQMITRLHKDHSITVELTSEPYKNLKIPFNIFFYMLGISRDDEIVSLITSTLDDPTDIRTIDQIVRRSIELSMTDDSKTYSPNYSNVTMNREATAVKQAMIEIVWKKKWSDIDDPNEQNALMIIIEKMLDTMFLVHQTMAGVTTAQDNEPHLCRIKKSHELARIVRTLILTYIGKHPSTDRDHVKHKRYHTFGVQMARFLKRFMNGLSMSWRKDITTVLRRTGYNPSAIIAIIQNNANRLASSTQFEQAIQNGDTTHAMNQNMTNSMHTEQLAPPKSKIYADAVRRSIASSPLQSKESDRAIQIRSVHSAIAGYNCCTTSPDTGDKVGLNKQLAIMTTITEPRPDTMIRDLIKEDFATDGTLIPWNEISSTESERYVRIYVNGDFYGSISGNPYTFLHKYRQMRRVGKIDRYTSIVFDVDKKEIMFFTDYGRLIRLWPVVKSNQWELDQYDDNLYNAQKNRLPFDTAANPRPKFFQWMTLTRAHLTQVFSGKLTLDELVDMEILEWITADEVINIVAAESHYKLVENQFNETMPYTHVLIPISLFGIPSLGSTLANHSQPARQTLQSNQIKQTNTYITPTWTILSLRNMYMQRLSQYPSTSTTADDISIPGGHSMNVEFSSKIDNEDDSLLFSHGFIMRGGLGTVSLNIVSAETKRSSEKFGIPDMQRTQRQPANYNLLKGDTVPIGTIVQAGDAIIAKYSEMSQSIGNIKFIDHSVIYAMVTPAYVYNIRRINDKNRNVIILNLCSIIEPAIGAKFSSRSGNKGVISGIIPECDMHVGVMSGRRPDIVVNAHSIPSRMLPGENISDLVGKMMAIKGTRMRVSPFAEVCLSDLIEEFRHIKNSNDGCHENPYGLEVMRNKYGNLTSPTFIGYAPRQCIQKFPNREISTRNRGPIEPITRNARAGAKSDGGLRLGEMETWTILSSGATLLSRGEQLSGSAYFNASVCRVCGRLAIYNAQDSIYDCMNCGSHSNITNVVVDYGMLALYGGVTDALNITISAIVEPFRDYYQ